MAEPTQVDIAILSWNRPEETIAAVASALAQTGVRRTVLLLDQGSEPANLARLKAFCDGKPDVVLECLDRNVGVAEGRNRATALGSAPVVIGLDNDAVFLDEGCAARAATYMDADPTLGGIAFRILDHDTREEQHWDYPEAHRATTADSFEVTRFLGGGYALRRAAFERVGGFDAALFFIGEERDVSWRIINAGYKLRWFRDLGVLHREDAGAKVTWSGRRFFFTVRNTLYINYKYRESLLEVLRAAAGFIVRGVRNGLALAALRGIWASVPMMWRFARSPGDTSIYRLSPEVRRYIRETDMKHTESIMQRLRRQFAPLPGH